MSQLKQFVVPFDSPDVTLEIAGGKGKSLARLSAAGLPVPPGFILATCAYNDFVEANDIAPAILDIVAVIEEADTLALEKASSDIQVLFEKSTIPSGAATAYPATIPKSTGTNLTIPLPRRLAKIVAVNAVIETHRAVD